MSFSTYVQEHKDQKTTRKQPMQILKSNLTSIKQYCSQRNQDWVFLLVGGEGSGKSTLASHIARFLDPDFKIKESMIYSFKEGPHNYIDFLIKNQDIPFKVGWFDEAVTVFFSQEHGDKEAKEAQKVFKINRDCNHYNILVTPSFWDLVPDIRERRAKTLLYCFVTTYRPTPGRIEYIHHVAYFSGEKIIRLSKNRKAKAVFRSHKALFKLVKPDFVESFPPMSKSFEDIYLRSKRDHRMEVIDGISGRSDTTEGTNKLLQPEGGKFDFSTVREQLEEMADEEVNECA